jgi:uroporphyrin-III C-methyltransferase/precorrin-2 dehydrogenase/sirohydrochlorin ferrochelatase
MDHFPIFLDVKHRRAVVVGGGEAAARKLELLIRAGARPLVVAPSVNAEIAAWVADGACDHDAAPFDAACLIGAMLVIIATDDETLTMCAAAAAQGRGLPVNVVDRPELSNFIMPAIVDRSPVVVAISTGGASPTLAQMIRRRIEKLLPPSISRLASLAGSLRPLVQRFLPTPAQRKAFWLAALSGYAAELVHSDCDGTAYLTLLAELDRVARHDRANARTKLDA